jgi:CheY-like chemotaxis protein
MTTSRRRTVLFVDPFVDECEMFSDYLRAAGCRVVAAQTTDAALTIALDCTPDAIVGRAGPRAAESLALVRRMRQAPLTRHTPIILLTTDSYSDRDIATEVGCDLVLLLPVFPEDLAAAIYRLVDHTHAA